MSVIVVSTIDEDCAGSCPMADNTSGIAAPKTPAIIIDMTIEIPITAASQIQTPAMATPFQKPADICLSCCWRSHANPLRRSSNWLDSGSFGRFSTSASGRVRLDDRLYPTRRWGEQVVSSRVGLCRRISSPGDAAVEYITWSFWGRGHRNESLRCYRHCRGCWARDHPGIIRCR